MLVIFIFVREKRDAHEMENKHLPLHVLSQTTMTKAVKGYACYPTAQLSPESCI